MISIDTSTLQQLVQAASTANDAINEAMEILNRISSHNDWSCKEKDAINDYTTNNKKRARQLHENALSYFNAVKCISHDFETAETGISDMFSSVESLLAGVLQAAEGVASNVINGVQTGVSVVQSIMDKILGKDEGIQTPADIHWQNNPDSEIVPIGTPLPDIADIADIIDITEVIGNNDLWSRSDGFTPPGMQELLGDFSLHNFTEPIPMCRCSDIQMRIPE